MQRLLPALKTQAQYRRRVRLPTIPRLSLPYLSQGVRQEPDPKLRTSVLVELQNVGVIVGIATGTETNVVVGTGSLNALPDGNYWVLSSRPSGAAIRSVLVIGKL